MTDIEWTGQDSLSARVGDNIVIRLDENPSTGFRNTIDITGTAVISTRDEFVPSPGAKIGGGGTRSFTVTAIAPGAAEIVLRRGRAGQDPDWERRVHVTVAGDQG